MRRSSQRNPVKKVLLSGIPLLLGGFLRAEPLSLEHFVRGVLDRHPGLSAADAGRRVAQAQLAEARAQRLPRLTASSQLTRGDGPVYAFASLLDRRSFTASDFAVDALNRPGYATHLRSSLALGVPLFAGFAIQSQERLAALGVEKAAWEEEQARQSLRRAVLEGALQQMLARQMESSLAARIEAAEEEIASAQKLRAKGLVLGSDYFAAEAVLSSLRAQRLEARERRAGAGETLALLRGDAVSPVEIAGSLEASPPSLPSEEAMRRALADRPDLAALDRGALQAATAARQAGRFPWPTVDALAEAQSNTDDFSSNAGQRLLMLRAQWALGDPARGARERRSTALASAARRGREALAEQAEIEWRRALRARSAAVAVSSELDRTVEQAQKSLELFRPLYREGRQSILDLVKAEQALADAEKARAEARHALWWSHVQVLAAAGLLEDKNIAALGGGLESRP